MSQTVAKLLETRGYWRFEMRPTEFVEKRIASTAALQRCIEQARVELRGWDFPHIGRTWDLPESQSWVGLEVESGTHVEIWRAFLSGQFVYRGGVWTDWLDRNWVRPTSDWEPSTRLPIVSSLWSITEFFEFAARFSQTDCGAESSHLTLSFHGLKERRLVGDHDRRVWFEAYGPARMQEFSFSRTMSRVDIVATAREVARAATQELFAVFGYTPHPGLLGSIQDELFALRGHGA